MELAQTFARCYDRCFFFQIQRVKDTLTAHFAFSFECGGFLTLLFFKALPRCSLFFFEASPRCSFFRQSLCSKL